MSREYKGKYPCVNSGKTHERTGEWVGEPWHMCEQCYRRALAEEIKEVKRRTGDRSLQN
jgi:hypothetical protein